MKTVSTDVSKSVEIARDFGEETRLYRRIALALIALALISVASATINFGSMSTNIVVAITIASIKATLVVVFFMGLRDGKAVPAVIFFASLAFLGLFLALTFVDATSRLRVVEPSQPHPTTPFVSK